MLYNDAYSVFAGGRHPELLGSKVREGWPEVAEFNDHVMRVGLAGDAGLQGPGADAVPPRAARAGVHEPRLLAGAGRGRRARGRAGGGGRDHRGVLAEQRLGTARRRRASRRSRCSSRSTPEPSSGPGSGTSTAGRLTVDQQFALNFGLDPLLGARGWAWSRWLQRPACRTTCRRSMRPWTRPLARGGGYRPSVPRPAVRRALLLDRGQRAGGPRPGRHAPALSGRPAGYRGTAGGGGRARPGDAAPQGLCPRRCRAWSTPRTGKGRMLVGNRGTSELLGKPPEDYLGLTDAEFLDEQGAGPRHHGERPAHHGDGRGPAGRGGGAPAGWEPGGVAVHQGAAARPGRAPW